MREQARYVNHRGEEISLNSGDIHLNTGSLANWKYGYTMMNGRPTDFLRTCEEIEIGAVVVGLDTRNKLYDIAIQDLYAESPGRLYIDDWFWECYLFRSNKDRPFLPAADYTMGIIPAEEPRLQRVKHYEFYSQAASGGMDFDYDFDYDFEGYSNEVKLIENTSVIPAPAVITIFGAATNPKLSVANNTYECECDIEMGGKLVIDGTGDGKITLYDRWGNSTNAFSTRRGEQYQGSGSYVFEHIPKGSFFVTTSQSLNFTIELHELRDEWWWRA